MKPTSVPSFQVLAAIIVGLFARRRGYLGPGSCPGGVRPLGKAVLAVEGDLVTLSHDEIRVNGAAVPNSRTVSEDSHGRSLPHYEWGDHRVKHDEFWLISANPHAYDSRYFGPVRTPQVVSAPRLIWPNHGRERERR